MGETQKITGKNLIMCEGRDEDLFLRYYLNSKERISEDPRYSTDVYIFNFGGISDLKKQLKTIRSVPGFHDIKTLLILRDAETDAQGAINQVKKDLGSTNFAVPEVPGEWSKTGNPRTAFLFFPTLGKAPVEGTLEDMCIKMIKEDYQPEEVIDSFEKTMEKLEEEKIREYPHPFKSKMHGFFSLTDKFVGMKIGEAAKAGAFDWNHPELKELNRMMLESFEIAES